MAKPTIETTLNNIVEYFLKRGYQHVKVNVWKQRRVYVALNVTDASFCYELDNELHIWSKDILSRSIYRDAKQLVSFLEYRTNCLTKKPCDLYMTGKRTTADKFDIYTT